MNKLEKELNKYIKQSLIKMDADITPTPIKIDGIEFDIWLEGNEGVLSLDIESEVYDDYEVHYHNFNLNKSINIDDIINECMQEIRELKNNKKSFLSTFGNTKIYIKEYEELIKKLKKFNNTCYSS